ncbi:MAG: hypothetical protein HZB81_07370 [Deltaproteobacteria bacterium]|nr:hypothetical protein [Deltaproteobacteria bacterium]
MDNKDFPITAERFIAYFDIMGFKDLVYRSDHKEVSKVMDIVCGCTKFIESKERDILTKPKAISESVHEKSIVLPVVFSDSILFISKSGSEYDAYKIIHIASFFLYGLLGENVPVKGALSYGTFTADFKKSSFFGRPLIDAFSLASEVHFYGAVLHNTFDCYINENKMGIDTKFLKRALVPMKNRDITHSYIDWRFLLNNNNKINSIINKFYDGVSGNIRSYVDNTIRLYDIK